MTHRALSGAAEPPEHRGHYLAGGMSDQEILADFPVLTLDDFRACLAFVSPIGTLRRGLGALE